ncbi:MAG: cell division protein FtsA [Rhodospirillales bacterium]|nr:cell division protein FtsA [Rhodospirillales bacterium]
MKRNKAAAQTKVRNGLIAALDIGTTKVCCLIARAGSGDALDVVGIGHQASQGVRGGTLIDLDGAETTIRSTVEAAERMAGDNIRGVVVNVSAGTPRSRLVAYEVGVAGHEIGDADLRRILDPLGFAEAVPDEHDIVHVIPVGYSIDGCRGVHDPRGMFGQRLGVNLHLITASLGAVRNVATCVTRCHLEVEGKVVSPYAAALGCLVDDETQLGVTLIDVGGGTTSVAVFFDSELIHTDSIPVGGLHVTRDLARGLSTPMTQAERIKTLYGSCQPSPSDSRQSVEVPPIADDGAAEPTHVPRSMLVGIIRPRMEEIFEMVRTRLKDAGFDRVAGRRTVLTGGACQLAGASDLAGQILDKQVRIGRPRGVAGLPEAMTGPAFATCAGLLRFAANQAREGLEPVYRPAENPSGRFGRLGQWLRENF